MMDKTAEIERIKFTEHLIASGYNYACGISAGEIDGDVDMDVVMALGMGAAENNPKYHQVILADLNGDGRLDIVACAERWSNEVRWWRNEGRVLK
ncbi:MAG: VCBS repeat-containing protein [Verrucomicrobia bacterium]|nr:VCBS repeat-containing protein [Verrucomicrobiota bacterium]